MAYKKSFYIVFIPLFCFVQFFSIVFLSSASSLPECTNKDYRTDCYDEQIFEREGARGYKKTYKGEWLNNKPHGKGFLLIEKHEDGALNSGSYKGSFKNGLSHGHGTRVWSDGLKYIGNWTQGKMHGHGNIYYPSGKIAYSGPFANNRQHGQGTCYSHKGKKFSCRYVNGKQTR